MKGVTHEQIMEIGRAGADATRVCMALLSRIAGRPLTNPEAVSPEDAKFFNDIMADVTGVSKEHANVLISFSNGVMIDAMMSNLLGAEKCEHMTGFGIALAITQRYQQRILELHLELQTVKEDRAKLIFELAEKNDANRNSAGG